MAISDRTLQPVLAASAVSLAAKVAHLSRPESYPEKTATVAALETHMSWVFLTDRHAYKLKKPVRYDFLDFSTLAARRHDCEQEVILNRRLAGDVYLGVVALTAISAGEVQLAGAGEVIDWLVKMRRLPDARRLDLLIAANKLKTDDLRRVASLLAAFYRNAAAIPCDAAAYRHRFEAEIRDCVKELSLPVLDFASRVKQASAALLHFVHDRGEMLDRRVKERRIIEAHGDLRPEHIFLLPKPVIIDCLEFNRAFRLLDPAEELSFLALECELIGAPQVGVVAFKVYGAITDDLPPPALIAFHKGFRALIRAKIAICHLKDREVRTPEKWPRQANTYLQFAERYAP